VFLFTQKVYIETQWCGSVPRLGTTDFDITLLLLIRALLTLFSGGLADVGLFLLFLFYFLIFSFVWRKICDLRKALR